MGKEMALDQEEMDCLRLGNRWGKVIAELSPYDKTIRVAKKRGILNNVVTVTVGIGASSEEFIVHDFLLKQSSSFFQAALKEERKEGQEKTLSTKARNRVPRCASGWSTGIGNLGGDSATCPPGLDEYSRADGIDGRSRQRVGESPEIHNSEPEARKRPVGYCLWVKNHRELALQQKLIARPCSKRAVRTSLCKITYPHLEAHHSAYFIGRVSSLVPISPPTTPIWPRHCSTHSNLPRSSSVGIPSNTAMARTKQIPRKTADDKVHVAKRPLKDKADELDEVRVAKRRRTNVTIINVTVGHGEDAKIFQLHDFLLKEHSEFFKAALNGQWKDGKDKNVKLPDDNPEEFDVYAEWLFCGKIASGTSKNVKPTKNEVWSEQDLLSRLYVLGEKLIDDEFCDCTLRALVELSKVTDEHGERYHPGGGHVRTVYDGTMQSSPIRKYLVDLYCQEISKDWFSEDQVQHYPKQFFVDIAREGLPLLNARKENDPRNNIERYLKRK
ncbi:hypothetical protein BST61_g1521 [Cercospora zeina]